MNELIVPDSIIPITGWRFWRICGRNLQLRSIFAPNPWPKREKITAECLCRGSSHIEPPEIESNCGVYAYKSLHHAIVDYTREFLAQDPVLNPYAGAIFGKVKLWGRIQHHRFGFRARFAYPDSFIMSICNCCSQPIFFLFEFFAFRLFEEIKILLMDPNYPRAGKKIVKISKGMFFCENCWYHLGKKNGAGISSEKILGIFQEDYGVGVSEKEVWAARDLMIRK
ncbi:hypothetical protein KKB71_03540 [Patescibacteria group bacterium]|nr:hypothetical protein [Patescibacteria group bacterium]MBU2219270.1 hypothetical protein [Patescibacteria group bacterium]